MLRIHVSGIGVYKFADDLVAQAKVGFELAEHAEIVLKRLKNECTCRHGLPTREKYEWKGNTLNGKELKFGKRND